MSDIEDAAPNRISAASGRRDLLCLVLQLVVVAGMVHSLTRPESDGIGSTMVFAGLSGLTFRQWTRLPPLRALAVIPLSLCAVLSGNLFFLGGLLNDRLLMVPVLPFAGVALVAGPYVWIRTLLSESMRRRVGHGVALLLVITWFWAMRPFPVPSHPTFHPFFWKAAPADRRHDMAADFLSRPDTLGMLRTRLVEMLGEPRVQIRETGEHFTYDLGDVDVSPVWLVFELEEGVVVDGHIEYPEYDD